MCVTQPQKNRLIKTTRKWCLSLSQVEIPSALEKFFFDGTHVRHDIIRKLIEEIKKIAVTLEEHPKWRIYGSSLLIVYDAASQSVDSLSVKMIDFAHVFPITTSQEGKDYGYLHGVYFLLSSLANLLARSAISEEESAFHARLSDKKLSVLSRDMLLKSMRFARLVSSPIRSNSQLWLKNEEEVVTSEIGASRMVVELKYRPAEADDYNYVQKKHLQKMDSLGSDHFDVKAFEMDEDLALDDCFSPAMVPLPTVKERSLPKTIFKPL